MGAGVARVLLLLAATALTGCAMAVQSVGRPQFRSFPYEITVSTGEKDGAGTSANVYIQLFGADGATCPHLLDNEDDNFENGNDDDFTIRDVRLSELNKIRIWHDNAGNASGWYLRSVTVYWIEDDEVAKRNFRIKEWLDEHTLCYYVTITDIQNDTQIVEPCGIEVGGT